MVGSRGKGSRSKPKDIKSVPAEPVPLKNSLDEAADVASDKEDGENDSLNKNEIPLEEELMDEMISGFIVSDGNGETEQNAHEFNDDEKDILTEANGEDFQEGKIDDVKEVSGGDADNEKVMEDEAKPEEDETPSEELNNDDARNGITENMAHDLENHKEPSKLDTDEPVGAPSDREEEHIENASITDNVKEVTGKVDKPKRKVIKRKLVKKKMVSGGDAATNVGVEDPEKRTEDETKPEDDETLSKELNNDDARNGITENMMHNLENHKEPSKLDADEPVGTPSDREEERIENANIADDVKEVTGKVDKPKRKVIKRKLVKKKVVRRCATAVSEEMPHPSDENNASGEVCKVDTNELVMDEVKASDVDATPVEEYKEDINEHVDNEEKDDVKSSVKINKKQIRIRKKKAPQGQSGVATVKDARKPLASEGHIGTSDPRVKNEEVEESGDRASPSKRDKNKKMAKKGSQEVVPKDVNKPKPSKEGKSSKRIDSMGMIFMCSSETKKDCYHYKVLGLPAGKKDMVLKIYKGMRLFLFDVDLRMMYGIYKAASPGGYNIEPKAFKSQFPSQVRFVVLEDCVPLAEERFRKVLKDNYYTRNKFNCQLNSEQVKNLCKLFHETNKKAESTKAASKSRRAAGASSAAKAAASASRRAAAFSLSAQAASASRRAAAASSSVRRDKKRKRVEDRPRRASPLRGRERSWRFSPAELRHPPLVIADRYYERPTYERASYLPSAAPAATLYQPLPARSPPRTNTYSYDRISEVDDPYRRHMVIDRRDLIPASRESRLPIEPDRYEPYVSYRDPPQVSSAPTYTTSDGRYADYYRPADYRPPPPLYRRY